MAKNKTYAEMIKKNTEECESSKSKYIFSVKVDDDIVLKFNASSEVFDKLWKSHSEFVSSVVIEDVSGNVYNCRSKYQLEALIRIFIYIFDIYNKRHFEYFNKIMKDEDVSFKYGDVKKSIIIPENLKDDVYKYRA